LYYKIFLFLNRYRNILANGLKILVFLTYKTVSKRSEIGLGFLDPEKKLILDPGSGSRGQKKGPDP
jgi:hypothetical protein